MKRGKEMFPCRKKRPPLVAAVQASMISTFQSTSFFSYEIFLLQHFHVLLIYDHSQDLLFYIPCTPSEFVILARLLSAPPGEVVPFEELSLHLSERASDIMTLLQRHISHLKKKLLPSWTIICELGIGYRLHVFPASEPGSLTQDLLSRSHQHREKIC
jgi:hypothetical protein